MGKKKEEEEAEDYDPDNEMGFDPADHYEGSSWVYLELLAVLVAVFVSILFGSGFLWGGQNGCKVHASMDCYMLSPHKKVKCRVPAAQHDEIVTGSCTNGDSGVFFHCQLSGYDACGKRKNDMKWIYDDPRDKNA